MKVNFMKLIELVIKQIQRMFISIRVNVKVSALQIISTQKINNFRECTILVVSNKTKASSAITKCREDVICPLCQK